MPVYLDWTYLLLMPALIFSLIASAKVKLTFNKYNKIQNRRGITGAQAARIVLDSNGLSYIPIQCVSGELTDHYDPKAQVIRLSDSTYSSASTAAVGVACHEAGHAVQHACNYAPANLRQAIIPVTNIGSKFGMWIFIAGLLLTAVAQEFIYLAYLGIGLFSMTAVFQLVTLSTEFDASKRALKAISDSHILEEDELKQTKKVLSAAAMTYVAALASSLAQVLRLLIILMGRSGRRRR